MVLNFYEFMKDRVCIYACDILSLALFGMRFKKKCRTLESSKRLLKASFILVSCVLFNFLVGKAFVKITQGN